MGSDAVVVLALIRGRDASGHWREFWAEVSLLLPLSKRRLLFQQLFEKRLQARSGPGLPHLRVMEMPALVVDPIFEDRCFAKMGLEEGSVAIQSDECSLLSLITSDDLDGAQFFCAGCDACRVLGGLFSHRQRGTSSVAGQFYAPLEVGVYRCMRCGGGQSAEVQSFGKDHHVRGEAISADMGAFPDVGVGAVFHCPMNGTSELRTARIALSMRADQHDRQRRDRAYAGLVLCNQGNEPSEFIETRY